MTAPKPGPLDRRTLTGCYGQSWYAKCPHCHVPATYPCVRMYRVGGGEVQGFIRKPHATRIRAAQKAREEKT